MLAIDACRNANSILWEHRLRQESQINGFDKIIKNKKNNFIPMTLTDRNKQTNMDYHK